LPSCFSLKTGKQFNSAKFNEVEEWRPHVEDRASAVSGGQMLTCKVIVLVDVFNSFNLIYIPFSKHVETD